MKTVFCIALVMSISFAAGVTNAQEPESMPPSQLANDSALPESKISKLQEELLVKLQPHIDGMKTVCNLSDAQVKKLKIASKDAAKNAAKKTLSQLGQHKQGDRNTKGFMVGRPIKVEDTEIWKLTVKKTLTDEQQKKYEAVVAERLKFRRNVAVQWFIARVDGKLLLSADQRKQLTEFIDKEYGAELTEFNAVMGENKIIFFGAVPDGEKPLEENSPIRKILSRDQQTIWEKLAAPELEMVRKEMAKELNFIRLQAINGPDVELEQAPLELQEIK